MKRRKWWSSPCMVVPTQSPSEGPPSLHPKPHACELKPGYSGARGWESPKQRPNSMSLMSTLQRLRDLLEYAKMISQWDL